MIQKFTFSWCVECVRAQINLIFWKTDKQFHWLLLIKSNREPKSKHKVWWSGKNTHSHLLTKLSNKVLHRSFEITTFLFLAATNECVSDEEKKTQLIVSQSRRKSNNRLFIPKTVLLIYANVCHAHLSFSRLWLERIMCVPTETYVFSYLTYTDVYTVMLSIPQSHNLVVCVRVRVCISCSFQLFGSFFFILFISVFLLSLFSFYFSFVHLSSESVHSSFCFLSSSLLVFAIHWITIIHDMRIHSIIKNVNICIAMHRSRLFEVQCGK